MDMLVGIVMDMLVGVIVVFYVYVFGIFLRFSDYFILYFDIVIMNVGNGYYLYFGVFIVI